jgi:protein gp37
MADSSIEWTDWTWNPVAGCTLISAGCTNCYAMRMAARLAAMGSEKYQGLTRKSGRRHVWTGTIRCDERALDAPRTWHKPRRIFVNSMSDLFHESVPVPFIRKVWRVMQETPRHTYQILTKRPERMVEVARDLPLVPNVWLGTSVEDNRVLERIDALRQVPAAIRFISFEPLIGSVAGADLTGIHWVIVGGESGPRARPMDPEWVNEIEVVLAIFPPCGCRDLDVVADDFKLILGPTADLLHEEAVVADHVAFGIERHSCCSDSSDAQFITAARRQAVREN